ncbi:hypothetical protein ACFLYV_04185 [Chloroflexota bacterium]
MKEGTILWQIIANVVALREEEIRLGTPTEGNPAPSVPISKILQKGYALFTSNGSCIIVILQNNLLTITKSK